MRWALILMFVALIGCDTPPLPPDEGADLDRRLKEAIDSHEESHRALSVKIQELDRWMTSHSNGALLAARLRLTLESTDKGG